MTLDEAARLIEASLEFRLIRRVPTPERWCLTTSRAETRRAVFVDVETTGLDQDVDEVIELALLPFDYERESGRIVAVHEREAVSAFREPSRSIPLEASKIHGITTTS